MGTNSIFSKPLAEILRPQTLDEFTGQENLIGKGSLLRDLIEYDNIPSMIFWGPPGVGKTTLARIIANETKSYFRQISAVDSGKADMKKVILSAKESIQGMNKKTILFIDEIHRFNKAQQDYLLPYVEDGTIILIGATTENPSFEVNSALISRLRVFVLEQHDSESLSLIIKRTINYLKEYKINLTIGDSTMKNLIYLSNGDPRRLINAIELACSNAKTKTIELDNALLAKVFQSPMIYYDKGGEEHYNIISALHKSMRSSDENASLYWLARMIEGGEDPIYIARRMLRFAAEDIGNADPTATVLANAVFDSCKKLGYPECNVHLAQLALYLAKAPKDNSAYIGILKAQEDAKKTLNLKVPLHLRNAPTKLMKELGYSKGYVYDHDVDGKKSGQQCMPDSLKDQKYL
jgi:putative ATPase